MRKSCFIFLCVFDIALSTNTENAGNKDGVSDRAKRTIHLDTAVRGLQALKVLLKGSKPLKTKSTTYRKFEKYGDFSDALKDFYSVQPRHIKILQKDVSHADYQGMIGDRIILLKENNYFGFTTLDIIQNGAKLDNRINRIIYKVR